MANHGSISVPGFGDVPIVSLGTIDQDFGPPGFGSDDEEPIFLSPIQRRLRERGGIFSYGIGPLSMLNSMAGLGLRGIRTVGGSVNSTGSVPTGSNSAITGSTSSAGPALATGSSTEALQRHRLARLGLQEVHTRVANLVRRTGPMFESSPFASRRGPPSGPPTRYPVGRASNASDGNTGGLGHDEEGGGSESEDGDGGDRFEDEEAEAEDEAEDEYTEYFDDDDDDDGLDEDVYDTDPYESDGTEADATEPLLGGASNGRHTDASGGADSGLGGVSAAAQPLSHADGGSSRLSISGGHVSDEVVFSEEEVDEEPLLAAHRAAEDTARVRGDAVDGPGPEGVAARDSSSRQARVSGPNSESWTEGRAAAGNSAAQEHVDSSATAVAVSADADAPAAGSRRRGRSLSFAWAAARFALSALFAPLRLFMFVASMSSGAVAAAARPQQRLQPTRRALETVTSRQAGRGHGVQADETAVGDGPASHAVLAASTSGSQQQQQQQPASGEPEGGGLVRGPPIHTMMAARAAQGASLLAAGAERASGPPATGSNRPQHAAAATFAASSETGVAALSLLPPGASQPPRDQREGEPFWLAPRVTSSYPRYQVRRARQVAVRPRQGGDRLGNAAHTATAGAAALRPQPDSVALSDTTLASTSSVEIEPSEDPEPSGPQLACPSATCTSTAQLPLLPSQSSTHPQAGNAGEAAARPRRVEALTDPEATQPSTTQIAAGAAAQNTEFSGHDGLATQPPRAPAEAAAGIACAVQRAHWTGASAVVTAVAADVRYADDEGAADVAAATDAMQGPECPAASATACCTTPPPGSCQVMTTAGSAAGEDAVRVPPSEACIVGLPSAERPPDGAPVGSVLPVEQSHHRAASSGETDVVTRGEGCDQRHTSPASVAADTAQPPQSAGAAVSAAGAAPLSSSSASDAAGRRRRLAWQDTPTSESAAAFSSGGDPARPDVQSGQRASCDLGAEADEEVSAFGSDSGSNSGAGVFHVRRGRRRRGHHFNAGMEQLLSLAAFRSPGPADIREAAAGTRGPAGSRQQMLANGSARWRRGSAGGAAAMLAEGEGAQGSSGNPAGGGAGAAWAHQLAVFSHAAGLPRPFGTPRALRRAPMPQHRAELAPAAATAAEPPAIANRWRQGAAAAAAAGEPGAHVQRNISAGGPPLLLNGSRYGYPEASERLQRLLLRRAASMENVRLAMQPVLTAAALAPEAETRTMPGRPHPTQQTVTGRSLAAAAAEGQASAPAPSAVSVGPRLLRLRDTGLSVEALNMLAVMGQRRSVAGLDGPGGAAAGSGGPAARPGRTVAMPGAAAAAATSSHASPGSGLWDGTDSEEERQRRLRSALSVGDDLPAIDATTLRPARRHEGDGEDGFSNLPSGGIHGPSDADDGRWARSRLRQLRGSGLFRGRRRPHRRSQWRAAWEDQGDAEGNSNDSLDGSGGLWRYYYSDGNTDHRALLDQTRPRAGAFLADMLFPQFHVPSSDGGAGGGQGAAGRQASLGSLGLMDAWMWPLEPFSASLLRPSLRNAWDDPGIRPFDSTLMQRAVTATFLERSEFRAGMTGVRTGLGGGGDRGRNRSRRSSSSRDTPSDMPDLSDSECSPAPDAAADRRASPASSGLSEAVAAGSVPRGTNGAPHEGRSVATTSAAAPADDSDEGLGDLGSLPRLLSPGESSRSANLTLDEDSELEALAARLSRLVDAVVGEREEGPAQQVEVAAGMAAAATPRRPPTLHGTQGPNAAENHAGQVAEGPVAEDRPLSAPHVPPEDADSDSVFATPSDTDARFQGPPGLESDSGSEARGSLSTWLAPPNTRRRLHSTAAPVTCTPGAEEGDVLAFSAGPCRPGATGCSGRTAGTSDVVESVRDSRGGWGSPSSRGSRCAGQSNAGPGAGARQADPEDGSTAGDGSGSSTALWTTPHEPTLEDLLRDISVSASPAGAVLRAEERPDIDDMHPPLVSEDSDQDALRPPLKDSDKEEEVANNDLGGSGDDDEDEDEDASFERGLAAEVSYGQNDDVLLPMLSSSCEGGEMPPPLLGLDSSAYGDDDVPPPLISGDESGADSESSDDMPPPPLLDEEDSESTSTSGEDEDGDEDDEDDEDERAGESLYGSECHYHLPGLYDSSGGEAERHEAARWADRPARRPDNRRVAHRLLASDSDETDSVDECPALVSSDSDTSAPLVRTADGWRRVTAGAATTSTPARPAADATMATSSRGLPSPPLAFSSRPWSRMQGSSPTLASPRAPLQPRPPSSRASSLLLSSSLEQSAARFAGVASGAAPDSRPGGDGNVYRRMAREREPWNSAFEPDGQGDHTDESDASSDSVPPLVSLYREPAGRVRSQRRQHDGLPPLLDSDSDAGDSPRRRFDVFSPAGSAHRMDMPGPPPRAAQPTPRMGNSNSTGPAATLGTGGTAAAGATAGASSGGSARSSANSDRAWGAAVEAVLRALLDIRSTVGAVGGSGGPGSGVSGGPGIGPSEDPSPAASALSTLSNLLSPHVTAASGGSGDSSGGGGGSHIVASLVRIPADVLSNLRPGSVLSITIPGGTLSSGGGGSGSGSGDGSTNRTASAGTTAAAGSGADGASRPSVSTAMPGILRMHLGALSPFPTSWRSYLPPEDASGRHPNDQPGLPGTYDEADIPSWAARFAPPRPTQQQQQQTPGAASRQRAAATADAAAAASDGRVASGGIAAAAAVVGSGEASRDRGGAIWGQAGEVAGGPVRGSTDGTPTYDRGQVGPAVGGPSPIQQAVNEAIWEDIWDDYSSMGSLGGGVVEPDDDQGEEGGGSGGRSWGQNSDADSDMDSLPDLVPLYERPRAVTTQDAAPAPARSRSAAAAGHMPVQIWSSDGSEEAFGLMGAADVGVGGGPVRTTDAGNDDDDDSGDDGDSTASYSHGSWYGAAGDPNRQRHSAAAHTPHAHQDAARDHTPAAPDAAASGNNVPGVDSNEEANVPPLLRGLLRLPAALPAEQQQPVADRAADRAARLREHHSAGPILEGLVSSLPSPPGMPSDTTSAAHEGGDTRSVRGTSAPPRVPLPPMPQTAAAAPPSSADGASAASPGVGARDRPTTSRFVQVADDLDTSSQNPADGVAAGAPETQGAADTAAAAGGSGSGVPRAPARRNAVTYPRSVLLEMLEALRNPGTLAGAALHGGGGRGGGGAAAGAMSTTGPAAAVAAVAPAATAASTQLENLAWASPQRAVRANSHVAAAAVLLSDPAFVGQLLEEMPGVATSPPAGCVLEAVRMLSAGVEAGVRV